MKTKDIIILIITLLVIVLFYFVIRGVEDGWMCDGEQWIRQGNPKTEQPTTGCSKSESVAIKNFFECQAAGFAIMESYPRQCRDDKDNLFVEDIGNEFDLSDEIVLDSPRPNSKIESPLTVSGKARGYWFFEGDFPVQLVATHGKVLSQGIAQAQGEWMTEDFVTFEVVLEFDNKEIESANLLLNKNNPSDFAENDSQLRVPLFISHNNDSEVSQQNHCAKYTRLGKELEVCAVCGDGVCENYEECISSTIDCDEDNPLLCTVTTDCGGLHCPVDCEKN